MEAWQKSVNWKEHKYLTLAYQVKHGGQIYFAREKPW